MRIIEISFGKISTIDLKEGSVERKMYLWTRYLLSCLLLPVVLIQGRQLRKTVQRLSEAEGERQGICRVSSATTIRLLSIGESPIAGVGLEHQRQNLTPQLAELIHQRMHNNVEWKILARSGLCLAQIIPLFTSEFPAKADIIFIGMGVNDCKEVTSMSDWKKQWNELYNHLKSRYPEAVIICSSVPPMASFPVLPVSLRLFLGCRSDLMNHILKEEIKGWSSSFYLPLPLTLSAGYFASDGFHPNAEAHSQWSRGILESLIAMGFIADSN